MFSTPLFLDWAKKNVILVSIDMPRKSKLPADLKKQNDALRSKFGVSGFPTILFMDAKEKQLGKSGYRAGGAEPWIKDAARQIK